jgi:hypothetical protein
VKLLAAIREQNKAFSGMVIGQAQKIEVAGSTVTFSFAPVHKTVRAQLESKRGWVEQVAASVAGRPMTVVVRESEAPAEPARAPAGDNDAARKADLTARAKREPSVQAVLDVFGGEIEDVEEMQ